MPEAPDTHNPAAQASAARLILRLREDLRLVEAHQDNEKLMRYIASCCDALQNALPIPPFQDSPDPSIKGIVLLIDYLCKSDFIAENKIKILEEIGREVSLGRDHWTKNVIWLNGEPKTVDASLGETLNLVSMALCTTHLEGSEKDREDRRQTLFNTLLQLRDEAKCTGGRQHDLLYTLNGVYQIKDEEGKSVPWLMIEDANDFMMNILMQFVTKKIQEKKVCEKDIVTWIRANAGYDCLIPDSITDILEMQEEAGAYLIQQSKAYGLELPTNVFSNLISGMPYMGVPDELLDDHLVGLLKEAYQACEEIKVQSLLFTKKREELKSLSDSFLKAVDSFPSEIDLVSLKTATQRFLEKQASIKKEAMPIVLVRRYFESTRSQDRESLFKKLIEQKGAFEIDESTLSEYVQRALDREASGQACEISPFEFDFILLSTSIRIMEENGSLSANYMDLLKKLIPFISGKLQTEAYQPRFLGLMKIYISFSAEQHRQYDAWITQQIAIEGKLGQRYLLLYELGKSELPNETKLKIFEEIKDEPHLLIKKFVSLYSLLCIQKKDDRLIPAIFESVKGRLASLISEGCVLSEAIKLSTLTPEQRNQIWSAAEGQLGNLVFNLHELGRLFRLEELNHNQREQVFEAVRPRLAELPGNSGELRFLMGSSNLSAPQRMDILMALRPRLQNGELVTTGDELASLFKLEQLESSHRDQLFTFVQGRLASLVDSASQLESLLSAPYLSAKQRTHVLMALSPHLQNGELVRNAGELAGLFKLNELESNHRDQIFTAIQGRLDSLVSDSKQLTSLLGLSHLSAKQRTHILMVLRARLLCEDYIKTGRELADLFNLDQLENNHRSQIWQAVEGRLGLMIQNTGQLSHSLYAKHLTPIQRSQILEAVKGRLGEMIPNGNKLYELLSCPHLNETQRHFILKSVGDKLENLLSSPYLSENQRQYIRDISPSSAPQRFFRAGEPVREDDVLQNTPKSTLGKK